MNISYCNSFACESTQPNFGLKNAHDNKFCFPTMSLHTRKTEFIFFSHLLTLSDLSSLFFWGFDITTLHIKMILGLYNVSFYFLFNTILY
jgi:hypothetical protein